MSTDLLDLERRVLGLPRRVPNTHLSEWVRVQPTACLETTRLNLKHCAFAILYANTAKMSPENVQMLDTFQAITDELLRRRAERDINLSHATLEVVCATPGVVVLRSK